MYVVKIPRWARALYPHRLWEIPTAGKVLFLTFDDGPNANTTTFILDMLRQYQAKATFFCIGKNVVAQPQLFRQLLSEGHRVGNHTHHHLNGWKVPVETYMEDIREAESVISSNLFRPPYGRMSKKQEASWRNTNPGAQIVMWTVLSGDFDTHISGEKCWENVRKNAAPGAIIVFHDSDKAKDRMQYALPQTLEYFQNLGYRFEVLPH